jgi:hypothetical protein
MWGPASGLKAPRTDEGTADNVVLETPKRRTFGRSRWKLPKCNNGIKKRSMKQRLRFGREKTSKEVLGQTFGLEVLKRAVEPSIRLRRTSAWTMWRSQPPFQTKEEASQASPLGKEGNSDTPLGYSGRAALRRKQCSMSAESQGTLLVNSTIGASSRQR